MLTSRASRESRRQRSCHTVNPPIRRDLGQLSGRLRSRRCEEELTSRVRPCGSGSEVRSERPSAFALGSALLRASAAASKLAIALDLDLVTASPNDRARALSPARERYTMLLRLANRHPELFDLLLSEIQKSRSTKPS